jgi:phosphoenolpyruvate synthase/pyruvate phosphate dikinase
MSTKKHISIAAGGAPFLIACGPVPAAALPPPEAIGFKAHNLARMARLGLPVPPAFVLDTSWCSRTEVLAPAQWRGALQALEEATELRFGDARRPLLLSVRSGAPVSMPGMMETLLDIGLNDTTVHGLVHLSGNPRLAWDAYRRLVAGFGEVVLGLPAAAFEADLAAVAAGRDERELDFAELCSITHAHLETVLRLHEGFDEAAQAESRLAAAEGEALQLLASAQSACTGVAVGEIALDEQRARERHATGAAVLLLRQDADTRDLAALELASGLLTARGARTSHAAVVARQLGKVCLVGCEALQIDLARRGVRLNGRDFAEGDLLTLDGHAGAVYAGAAQVVREAPAALMQRLAALRAAGAGTRKAGRHSPAPATS